MNTPDPFTENDPPRWLGLLLVALFASCIALFVWSQMSGVSR